MKKEKNTFNTFNLCCGALMTAVICMMTIVIQIPIPLGYAHLGDAFILLAVLYLNRREAMLAAGLGSALADLLSGFSQWAVPTLFIKIVIAWIASVILFDSEGNCKIFSVRNILASVLSMAWMVVGYVFFGAILYGSVAAGLASAPGLIAEGVVNIAAYFLLAKVLEKAHVRRLIEARQ